MASSSTSAHPIRTLREHVTALEAAITLCLADPKPRAVHRLRTTTRRIEGQLFMLALLPDIPAHDKFARKTRRILKELRRAAGKVRDLDVQLELIQTATPENASPALEHDSVRLRSELEEQRGTAGKKLVRKLQKRQGEVTVLLESLLEALAPAEARGLSPAELTKLARDWFANNMPEEPEHNPDEPDYLHSLRKNAKLSRYIAENAPKSAKTPRGVAASYEAIQEAGGHWHDWLVLAEIASSRLGASSPLTKTFTQRCHHALTVYRRNLHRAV